MAREWKTISVKVDAETRNNLVLICKRENKHINKFLAGVIKREVEHVRTPSVLPENKGMPQIGENKLKYQPETDNFLWEVDLGVDGSALLGENVSPSYLESLKKAIDEGLAQRAGFRKGHNGAVIPPKLLKYGVKKNVST